MSPTLSCPDTLAQTAAAWAARRTAGFTPEAQAEFERWLAENPLHYAAFTEADLAKNVLLAPDLAAQETRTMPPRKHLPREQAGHARRWQRWRNIVAAIGLAALAALIFALRPREPATIAASASPATIVPRPLIQRLPDGSLAQQNAHTEFAVEFTASQRVVRLVHGEAYFTVAKDPARPFVVIAGRVSIRAVGTRFDVRIASGEVDVLTDEGRVEVTDVAPNGFTRDATVGAGYRTTVSLGPNAASTLPVTRVAPGAAQAALAWRDMRFELIDATLEQAVAWFNERSLAQFAIGDASLRQLRLSGFAWADDPDEFVKLLAASLPVKAMPERNDRTVLLRR